MKKILCLLFIIFLSSCNQTNTNKIEPLKNFIESSNSKNLDSLSKYVSNIPQTNDTILLGFRIGMTKTDFKNHVSKLRTEGLILQYQKNVIFRGVFGNQSIGTGYTFISDISCKKFDETYTGNGKYYLRPYYSKNDGKLFKLSVKIFEEWDNNPYTFKNPCDWLKSKLNNDYKSVPIAFKDYSEKYIKGFSISDRLEFVKQKDNVFVYGDGLVYDLVWETKKSFFKQILENKIEEDKKIRASKQKIKV
jgi:hypothetical protein